MSEKIIILSGGFDPIHSGHIAMFEEARNLGQIVVLLNSDDWLKRKKGNFFMDWNNRNSVVGNVLMFDFKKSEKHIIPKYIISHS